MGLVFAVLIMGLWGGHLAYALTSVQPGWTNPWMYLHLLIQGYLYTGLFITGHDAMHRTVSKAAWINKVVGFLSVFLFAGMSYSRLMKNHWEHHKYPGTEKDPDFYVKSQNFFAWWAAFMIRYTTLWQLLAMAAIYNVFVHLFKIPIASLLVFWILPAFVATFQLFYFGTFLPHKWPHTPQMGKHKARTIKKNHLWALISCYFFGYHREHHESPGTPWWKLYQLKKQT